MSQIAKMVAMVRPAAFGFNEETASSNAFQHNSTQFSPQQVQDIALLEFDNMVQTLRDNGIQVHVFEDKPEEGTPDSIFPNNWFSTFSSELVLYPMFSKNRQQERKERIYSMISALLSKPVNDELLSFESKGEILEGTGSLVCDHDQKVAFAAQSARTTKNALDRFSELSNYSTVSFKAYGPDGDLIYHTNVMMTMGDTFCVLGLDCIDKDDRSKVEKALKDLNKDVLLLSNDQVFNHFAGNMLQLSNEEDEKFLVMSTEAFRSLGPEQIEQINSWENKILHVPIHMIEKIGGGSARCMMAELFTEHA